MVETTPGLLIIVIWITTDTDAVSSQKVNVSVDDGLLLVCLRNQSGL